MSESMMTTNSLGNKFWRNSKGEYHRTDGPALELLTGTKAWFVNGERHRINGPALEFSSGRKAWYIYGQRLGTDEEGFWALWDRLTPEQKKDPILLSYLPEKF